MQINSASRLFGICSDLRCALESEYKIIIGIGTRWLTLNPGAVTYLMLGD